MTYDLIFRRWLRLEIDRIMSEITTTLAAADNDCYVYIAELCKLVIQGQLLAIAGFTDAKRNSHAWQQGLSLRPPE
jgi:hypothetical protein